MKRLLLFVYLLSISFIFIGQDDIIEFDSGRWNIINGEITEFMGKQCLKGTAALKDVQFADGVIEFNMAVTGERSYPGIFFREQSPGEYEHFYIRPHRIWYDDALQYAPAFKGASCWQLYHGEGINAAYNIPKDQWMHFRIEVKDNQAQVFIDNGEEPVLFINDLKHGISTGGITLNAPANGSAYFADFQVSKDKNSVFPPRRKADIPYGMIMDWEVSELLNFAEIDYGQTAEAQELSELKWTKVRADKTGLLNLSKIYSRTYRSGDAVFARTSIYTEKDQIKKFSFGYSDVISVFLNGQIYFTGVSTYQSRDRSFLGILGLNDMIYLPLKKGENELIIMMAEGFGGWGFMFQTTDIYTDERLEEVWQSNESFVVPESVLYDPNRDVLYVTNFDQFTRNTSGREQYISRLSLEGELLERHFIDSLDNPLGMTIFKDKLYVAEKGGFVIVELKTTEIIERTQLPEALFPNDIEVDNIGRVYVSDSRKNVIWRSENGNTEIWLEGENILDPNSMKIINNRLYVGNSGDQCLKSFDLNTKEMIVEAEFGPGFIDGIRPLPDGGLLVSQWDGRLFYVAADGSVTKLLDLKNADIYIADFEYIPETGMLFIPTFFENRVLAYKVNW